MYICINIYYYISFINLLPRSTSSAWDWLCTDNKRDDNMSSAPACTTRRSLPPISVSTPDFSFSPAGPGRGSFDMNDEQVWGLARIVSDAGALTLRAASHQPPALRRTLTDVSGIVACPTGLRSPFGMSKTNYVVWPAIIYKNMKSNIKYK